MVGSLRLHRDLANQKLLAARNGLQRYREGSRGGSLKVLLDHVLEVTERSLADHDSDLLDAERISEVDLRERLLANVRTKYERRTVQLRLINLLLHKYGPCIDRDDLPVGLHYLIDVVVREVTDERADPIIYLEPFEGYSTVDLINDIAYRYEDQGGLEGADGHLGKRPIALNLPAEDPENALLAPVLVHEVTHVAVDDTLGQVLAVEIAEPAKRAMAELDAKRSTLQANTAEQWREHHRDWSTELLCDAVATAVTGPAFLLAYMGVAKSSHHASVGSHPPEDFRVAFMLRLLRRLGWEPLINELAPGAWEWFDSVGQLPRESFGEEQYLRTAMADIEDSIVEVALRKVSEPLQVERLRVIVGPIIDSLGQGIPAVDDSDGPLTIWEILLGGWLTRLAEDTEPDAKDFPFLPADHGAVIAAAVGDLGFNQLLIKSIELAGIVSAWRQYERTGS